MSWIQGFIDLFAEDGVFNGIGGVSGQESYRGEHLGDVVDHYDSCMNLGLSAQEKNDISQYLLSLPNPSRAHDRDRD